MDTVAFALDCAVCDQARLGLVPGVGTAACGAFLHTVHAKGFRGWMRGRPEPGREGQDQARPGDRAAGQSGPDRGLCCVRCGLLVTWPDQRRERDGSHVHAFFNPHGHLFELGVFATAPGARPLGRPSLDFTWFAGCAWRVAECRGCGAHLGWEYRDQAGGTFFGLILDRLAERQGPGRGA